LKGQFSPQNPQKYNGNPCNIIYRSSWELKMFMFLDTDPRILKWSSEEIFIPYRSPKDNKIHRYFPDIIYTTVDKKTIMVEIKPFKQTNPPNAPKDTKGKRRYITEVMTYGVNQAKWAAAQEYCADRGWEFKIITENELGIKY